MTTTVVRVDDIDVVRQGNLLLDSISLTVREGEHGRCSGPTAPARAPCSGWWER